MSRAVATPRHLAVLKEVGRACELSDVQHVVEPSAILEDPNGSGIKIELDMLMRDSAGMLIGVDTTVGTWDKESTRVQHVRAKMYGTGTMGARQVAQARLAEVIAHTKRELAGKRMFAAVAEDIVGRQAAGAAVGQRQQVATAGAAVRMRLNASRPNTSGL